MARRFMATAGSLMVALALVPAARAADPGALDSAFGSSGISRITSSQLAYPEIKTYRYARQSDGKVLVGAVTARGDVAISRLTNAMALDRSFGIGGTIVRDFGSSNDKVADVTVLPDGKILVAGSSGSAYFVQRWESNGLLDTSFGQNGTARVTFPRVDRDGATIPGIGEAEAERLAVDPANGALSVVGWVRRLRNGATLAGIARFTAAGALDTTFGDGTGIAIGFNPDFGERLSIDSAMIDSQHRLVLGEVATWQTAYIARVTAAGEVDTAFGNQGTVHIPTTQSTLIVRLTPGDGLLATGRSGIHRYTADGTLDTSYGTGGTAAVDTFGVPSGALLVLADGSAITRGQWIEGSLVRLNANGVRDRAFDASVGESVPALGPYATLVATDAGFDVLSHLGRASYSLTGTHLSEVRVTPQQFTGVERVARQIVRRPSGGFVALTVAQNGDDDDTQLIALTASGLIDTSFGSAGSVTVSSATRMIAVDGAGRTLVVARGASATGLLVRRFTASGVLDNAFGSSGTVEIAAIKSPATIAYQAGYGILLMGYTDATPHARIVRLTDAGALDSTFGVGGRYAPAEASASISNIALGNGGSIYAADYDSERVTRLAPSGRIDATYGSGGSAPMKDFAPDGTLAVGPSGRVYFSVRGGGIDALTPSGVADPAFFVDASGALESGAATARSFVVDANDRVAVAFALDGRLAVRRYGVDGSLDPSFGAGGTAVVPFEDGLGSCVTASDMLLEPDGGIVTAGCSDGDAVLARQLGGGPVPPVGDPILNAPDVEATAGVDTHLRFTIGLSRPAAQPATVHAKTVAAWWDAAVAGVDYTAVDTTVTIPQGGSFVTVDVPIQPHPGAYDSLQVMLALDPVPGVRMRATSAYGRVHQAPAAPGIIDAPALFGPLKPGDRTSCSTGYWSGTLPHQYAVAWLRDGTPISGQTEADLTVRNADAGHTLACRVTATNALGSASATTDGVLVAPATDFNAPTITIRTPAEGAHYLRGEDVDAWFSCNDAGGTGVERCSGAEFVETSTPGPHTFVVTASDYAGNATSKTVNYIVDASPTVDTTPPTITVVTPAEGQHFVEGAVVRSAFSCADPGGSGIASCQGPEFVDTRESGAGTFTATATDKAGNRTTVRVGYVVDRQPVDATPTPTPTATAMPVPTTQAPPTSSTGDRPPAPNPLPSVAAPSRTKLSSLTKGVSTKVTGVRARSSVTVSVRLGARTLTSIKAKADAAGRAKVVVKLSKKQRRGLRKGQKLSLRFTLTGADGKRKTINRTIAIS